MSTGDMPRCGICGAWLFPTDGPPHMCQASTLPTTYALSEIDRLKARLAEEVENAATYKQERDEICVNYETEAAQLTEAHRQNADLMAIIDKRDEALGFIPLDKGMDMMDELREAKARLAEAEALLVEGTRFPMLTGERADWLIRARDWLGPKRPADSAEGGA